VPHTIEGEAFLASGIKTSFPWNMSPQNIESTIRQAWRTAQKVKVGRGSLVPQGRAKGVTIEMNLQ
jgi:hypothetical protein